MGTCIIRGTGPAAGGGQAKPSIPDDYIKIYTASDLDDMRNDMWGKYILMNDIDLQNFSWVPFEFRGVLDGNGYSIKRLTLSGIATYGGLFLRISPGDNADSAVQCAVRNLTVENFNIMANAPHALSIGAICGEMWSALIENCRIKYGAVNAQGDGYKMVGGVCGALGSGVIKNCIAEIDGTLYSSNCASGGITTMLNYQGAALMNNVVLTGQMASGSTVAAWTGRVTGIWDGGSGANVGWNYASVGVTVGSGGVTSQYAARSNGKDLTVAECKQKATYETLGFDMNTVWDIEDGAGYPFLRKGIAT